MRGHDIGRCAAAYNVADEPHAARPMTPLTRRLLVLLASSLPLLGVHAQSPLPKPTQPVILTVDGAITVRNEKAGAVFDAAMIDALPVHSIRTWTPWFPGPVTFSGPLLSDLLDAVGAKGQTLHMVALNDYAVDVPMADARRFGPVLARRIDGKVIGVREKGPLFLIYPFDDKPDTRSEIFYSRSIWQLARITVR